MVGLRIINPPILLVNHKLPFQVIYNCHSEICFLFVFFSACLYLHFTLLTLSQMHLDYYCLPSEF